MKRCRGMNLSWVGLFVPSKSRISCGFRLYDRDRIISSKVPDTRWLKMTIGEFLALNESSFPFIECMISQLQLQQSSHYLEESSTEGREDEKSIGGMVRKTNLRMESSVHEMGEILGKASEEIYKALVRSQPETLTEIRQTEEEAINKMVKKLDLGDKSLAKCFSKYKVDLEGVRTTFSASSEYCTERAMRKFEKTETEGEIAAEKKATASDVSVENSLEYYARDKNRDKSLIKCLNNQKTVIRKRFDDFIILINIRIPKKAKKRTVDIARETIECHLNAHQETAIEGFRQILNDAVQCFAKKKDTSKFEETQRKNDTMRVSAEHKNYGKAGVKICGEKSRAETKMAIDILRQDLISCSSYLFRMTEPNQDLNSKQYILLKSQEILLYLRGVSDNCKKTYDFMAYAKEEMSTIEAKLNSLQETVNTKFSHVPNVLEKSVPFEKCWRGSFGNAVKRLRVVEKNCKFNSEK